MYGGEYERGYMDCYYDMLAQIKDVRERIEESKNAVSLSDYTKFYNNGLDTALAIIDKFIEEEENETR